MLGRIWVALLCGFLFLTACDTSEERAEKHFQSALEYIENGDIDPDPSASDPMVFSWEFCLFIQVLTTLDTEIFQVF